MADAKLTIEAAREAVRKFYEARGGRKRTLESVFGAGRGYRRRRRYTPPDFYKSPAWIEIRDRRLVHAHLKCEECGRGRAEGGILDGHHVKPIGQYPELALDFDNIKILCQFCHCGKHPHMRKRYPRTPPTDAEPQVQADWVYNIN